MAYISLNPKNNEVIKEYREINDIELEGSLSRLAEASNKWKKVSIEERAALLNNLAAALRNNKERFAEIISNEMGKLLSESIAEVEKSALGCEFYADNAKEFLRDTFVETDATKSIIKLQPLGAVLLVMPWNFPFWQVFRCASAAIISGNSVALKHASNVPGCAEAIQQIFNDVEAPEGLFENLFISSSRVEKVILDRRINAVALTGSEHAGRSVASAAGKAIKPSLLELGGADAFVVLDDADIGKAVDHAVRSRFSNAGQSCIAAKRFIVIESIADKFISRFSECVSKLKSGDPLHQDTSLAPLARRDILDEVEEQVIDAISLGAKVVIGGKRASSEGNYFEATIIDNISLGMRLYEEESFGPVASVIRVNNEEEALAVANCTKFGLGGSVWTNDIEKGIEFASKMECGSAFVNGMVKSDPRLPFGGIKESGYGRELGKYGIHEFVNVKTMSIF